MGFKEFLYFGTPRGINQTTALIILLVNVIAPGVGTIISAFLAPECKSETVWAGVLQILTTPLLGLGFIWAIVWSVNLYKTVGVTNNDEEDPLIASEPVTESTDDKHDSS